MGTSIIQTIKEIIFPPSLHIKKEENIQYNYKGEIKYSEEETPYELLEGAYRYYINSTKHNKNLTFEEARCKLSSNALSGKKMKDCRDGVEVYRYGNLAIKVMDGVIVYIKNYIGQENKGKYRLNIDVAYRDYLRNLWGVSDK